MTSFIPALSPKYFAPAVFKSLSETGALQEFAFDCEFKRHTKEELTALDAQIKSWREMKGGEVDAKVLARVCTAWRVSVPKADGSPGHEVKVIPYSDEAAQQMDESHPGFIAICVRAFYISTAPAQAAHLAEKN